MIYVFHWQIRWLGLSFLFCTKRKRKGVESMMKSLVTHYKGSVSLVFFFTKKWSCLVINGVTLYGEFFLVPPTTNPPFFFTLRYISFHSLFPILYNFSRFLSTSTISSSIAKIPTTAHDRKIFSKLYINKKIIMIAIYS